jgi:hypothetical protein
LACCRRCCARRPIAMPALYKRKLWIAQLFLVPASRLSPRAVNDGRVVPNFMKQAMRGEDLTV